MKSDGARCIYGGKIMFDNSISRNIGFNIGFVAQFIYSDVNENAVNKLLKIRIFIGSRSESSFHEFSGL